MTNAEKFKRLFGIYATELWAMSEEKFLEWLNAEALEGNYEPTNCTWIPMSEQYDNKRQNIMIDWMGERHNATYWARKTGIPAGTIRWRYKHGWDIERIFSTLPEPYQEDKA